MKKLFLLLIIQFFAISTIILAQDFEVAPIQLNFRIEPGGTESRTVTVKNHGNRKESITLTKRDFLVHRNGNREVLPAGSIENSISDWATVNPSFLELQPNEEKEIQVTFQAPVDDDHPAKWGILSFASAVERTAYTADKDVESGIFLSGRIDIFLTYNPPTDQDPNVVISNLREISPKEDGRRVFAVDIDNIGSTLARSEIFLIASSLETDVEKKFETQRITAYPRSSRKVELILPDVLEKGKYSLAAILDYGSRTELKGTQITIEVD